MSIIIKFIQGGYFVVLFFKIKRFIVMTMWCCISCILRNYRPNLVNGFVVKSLAYLFNGIRDEFYWYKLGSEKDTCETDNWLHYRYERNDGKLSPSVPRWLQSYWGLLCFSIYSIVNAWLLQSVFAVVLTCQTWISWSNVTWSST